MFGSTRTPSSRMNDQKLWPARCAADFAAQRHRHDLGARSLDRFGQDRRRRIRAVPSIRREEARRRRTASLASLHGRHGLDASPSTAGSPARAPRERNRHSAPSRSLLAKAQHVSAAARVPALDVTRVAVDENPHRSLQCRRSKTSRPRPPGTPAPAGSHAVKAVDEGRRAPHARAGCRERPAADRRRIRDSASPKAGWRHRPRSAVRWSSAR